jgi:Beta-lactamase
MSNELDRRALLFGAARAAAGVASAGLLAREAAGAEEASNPIFPVLDGFIERYMRAMNASGLTLALANAGGVMRVKTYGLADLEARAPVTPDLLFEIGSITKSFVALTLLQLRDEGKLDLQRPVLDWAGKWGKGKRVPACAVRCFPESCECGSSKTSPRFARIRTGNSPVSARHWGFGFPRHVQPQSLCCGLGAGGPAMQGIALRYS